jgi:hypothetical protein
VIEEGLNPVEAVSPHQLLGIEAAIGPSKLTVPFYGHLA